MVHRRPHDSKWLSGSSGDTGPKAERKVSHLTGIKTRRGGKPEEKERKKRKEIKGRKERKRKRSRPERFPQISGAPVVEVCRVKS